MARVTGFTRVRNIEGATRDLDAQGAPSLPRLVREERGLQSGTHLPITYTNLQGHTRLTDQKEES